MKFILFALLFSSLSMASEIQTSMSETQDGLEFSLYEIVYPGEEAPLWNFAQGLLVKEMTTSDGNFSFKCKQAQVTKSVYETRCSGVLIESIYPSSVGAIGNDFISITLTGATADQLVTMFRRDGGAVNINVKDKLVMAGSVDFFTIMVRH